LTGVVEWRVETRGLVARVEFLVDGTVRATVAAAPYVFALDTAAEQPGPHVLVARAIAPDGRAVERSTAVTIAPSMS
jgi:hypothetical protein